jgi:hypothetical protein
MTSYELSNDQRKYFGLTLVNSTWYKQSLSGVVSVYFDTDKIVKVLKYTYGYVETDTDIDTKNKKILLPKTSRGKEQKLTVPRLLKINGSGVQFSGSFQGGGIHVYDFRRKLFFIKSFSEEGEIKTYEDIDNWAKSYVSKADSNYFEWLDKELSQKRLRVKIQEGDIIAFKISHDQYGFARVLLDVFAERKKGDIIRPELHWFHPRSLFVAPYAYFSDKTEIDIDALISKKTLPTLCMFDLDVYRGEMPIIGHRPLTGKDREIPFPTKKATSFTIPYTKTDIETFIATNGNSNKLNF